MKPDNYGKPKKRLTEARRKIVRQLLKVPLWQGYARAIYLCLTCGQISANDYIPRGLGSGPWRNQCMDALTSSNWIHRQARQVAERPVRRKA